MLIAQIEDKIRLLRQDDGMSVMTYVAELQALWADQDNCDPLELYDAASIESGHKWMARRRVLKFLAGLKGCFDGRKASLLHQPSLPTIPEAIAAMTQEEAWLSLEQASVEVVPASAFGVTKRTCGEVGHLKWGLSNSWRRQGI